ncbi:MAG: CRISPR-associated protein Cas4, partial [Pannonibacter indicus]
PVEYKRGKAKLHRADEVQLCAQALCLEEMTGRPVPAGALFYAEPKRRLEVPFDADLRELTERTVADLAAVFASSRTPPPVYRADRCRACSLSDLCRPKQVARPVLAWRQRQIAGLLSEEDPS